MLWMLLACMRADPIVSPGAPAALPDTLAWAHVRPLDGAPRLFGGPFRCALPDGTDVSFHPNGMARGEPAFRGNWRHEGNTLTAEARHEGVEQQYRWPYEGFARRGDWMLATPEGALACRPGHDTAPGPAGDWIRVLDAGGDAQDAGHALVDAPGIALAVDAHATDPSPGIVLRHRPSHAAPALAQHLADRLQQPIRIETVPDLTAPYELRVGAAP